MTTYRLMHRPRSSWHPLREYDNAADAQIEADVLIGKGIPAYVVKDEHPDPRRFAKPQTTPVDKQERRRDADIRDAFAASVRRIR